MRPPRRLSRNLPDNPSDPRVTSLRDAFNAPKKGDFSPDAFVNRNVTNTTPFQLVGGAPAIRALPRNPRRVGLQINNIDAGGNLVYSFGNAIGPIGLTLIPNGMALYDFSTPPDELYLFSTVNLYVVVMDITRGF
jgi:hypothetical protein